MLINDVPAGKNIPEDIYVIIEISAYSTPIKYEIDKKTGITFVDRFIPTPMFYPCNYGFVNHTLSLDGDPIDVLVPTPHPLQPGCVILCRPIGVLNMIDESGEDFKILAVPHEKLSQEYTLIKNIQDLPKSMCNQITYFFEYYKNLEPNKWTKINGWEDSYTAKIKILDAIQRKNK